MPRLVAQPRIPGVRRAIRVTALLPVVQDGLLLIAKREHRSLSWVVAQIVSDYFDLDAATARPLRTRKKAS